ncbi:MAG: DUF91 domain-containing protein [Bacteroidetes bacterium]|nr:DUF91 domain-containing protein [Bacteroidota bacterium]
MDEKTIQDILYKYHELIEEGLTPLGKEVSVKGKRIDLLFHDRHGIKLIVELKKGTVVREHLGQILDYEGYYVTPDDPDVRTMLIGNKVPVNFRNSMNNHGIEWREFPISFLVNFLKGKDQYELLNRFTEEDLALSDKSNLQHQSRNLKRRPINQNATKGFNPLSDTIRPSNEAIKRAVESIREEYLKHASFHSVRNGAEEAAKKILDRKNGRMSTEDIKNFLHYLNTENIKGKTGTTRFGRQVTNIQSSQICNSPDQFNKWIGKLWVVEEDNVIRSLANFFSESPIKGARTLLPTFILYLRKPGVYNIWTENLAFKLNLAIPDNVTEQAIDQIEQYERFNSKVMKHLVLPYDLLPQEVDLVLSKLPAYFS